jgi:hypothetical protein
LASDLEDAIKREQMEIFALEQIITEKQAEVSALSFQRVHLANSIEQIKRNPMVVKPKPKAAVIPPSQSNPFGKSTLLEQKASPVRRSPAPARKVATPVRQPSPAVVVAPQSTPRAVRTVQPATPSPRRLATAAADVTPRAVRSSPGVVVKKKAPVGVSSDDLEAVTVSLRFPFLGVLGVQRLMHVVGQGMEWSRRGSATMGTQDAFTGRRGRPLNSHRAALLHDSVRPSSPIHLLS